jgi:hypothetical protein
MSETNQGVLMYTCPDTGRGVTTGISTDDSILARMGQLQLSVWWPYCETPHAIKHKEAMLVHLQITAFPSGKPWAAFSHAEAEQA